MLLSECQDFWRLSGVARDCYLYAREPKGIEDVRLSAGIEVPTYRDGKAKGTLQIELRKSETNLPVQLTLRDAEGQVVLEQKGFSAAKGSFELGEVKTWSAETPLSLYPRAQDSWRGHPPAGRLQRCTCLWGTAPSQWSADPHQGSQ